MTFLHNNPLLRVIVASISTSCPFTGGSGVIFTESILARSSDLAFNNYVEDIDSNIMEVIW